MLRFKDKTGKEAVEIKASEISLICVYLWCTVKSACAREGKAFDYDVQDFCDRIDPETVRKWQESLKDDSEEPEEKKAGENNRAFGDVNGRVRPLV